jgi:hypothetical protein
MADSPESDIRDDESQGKRDVFGTIVGDELLIEPETIDLFVSHTGTSPIYFRADFEVMLSAIRVWTTGALVMAYLNFGRNA